MQQTSEPAKVEILSPQLVSVGVAALPDAETAELSARLINTTDPHAYAAECSRYLLSRFTRAQLLVLDQVLNHKQAPEPS